MKKLVMIIEDNPVHGLLMTHIVEDLEQDAVHYLDVDATKEGLKTQIPDLFIVDMNIADSMNATKQFVKDLYKTKSLKHIPILIISAYVSKDGFVKEFPYFSKDDVIEKPSNVETISKRIKTLLKM